MAATPEVSNRTVTVDLTDENPSMPKVLTSSKLVKGIEDMGLAIKTLGNKTITYTSAALNDHVNDTTCNKNEGFLKPKDFALTKLAVMRELAESAMSGKILELDKLPSIIVIAPAGRSAGR